MRVKTLLIRYKQTQFDKGQLLPRCEHELWLMQLSMYYQSLYLQITKGYVCLKMECKDYILAQKTAIDALRFDPKDSELNKS